MTLRNWAIGYYIVEYEQGGSDRAEYGAHLLKNLENQISEKGLNITLFKACRQFYLVYPQIGSTVSNFWKIFYETECIKCNWSVRELRRQIKTNLYVRAGISKKPELLIQPSTDNKDAKDTVSESDLEQALMDHLQEFMLELGEGFCFEARKKRIIIDDKYYFVDLVFYNRLLHCNVIIELK